MKRPILIAMDLEGVLIPEVWIAVAERTGIERLRLTTRDIPDYDQLMAGRLALLRENDLTIRDIRAAINEMAPLDGALDFLRRIRAEFQVVILSDTFYEFADPFMEKLERPTLFCNSLAIDTHGNVTGYRLRMADGKRHAVLAFRQLNFDVVATGDSYNDTTMLAEANRGILFRPSENVREEFPQFPTADTFSDLLEHIHTFRDERE